MSRTQPQIKTIMMLRAGDGGEGGGKGKGGEVGDEGISKYTASCGRCW